MWGLAGLLAQRPEARPRRSIISGTTDQEILDYLLESLLPIPGSAALNAARGTVQHGERIRGVTGMRARRRRSSTKALVCPKLAASCWLKAKHARRSTLPMSMAGWWCRPQGRRGRSAALRRRRRRYSPNAGAQLRRGFPLGKRAPDEIAAPKWGCVKPSRAKSRTAVRRHFAWLRNLRPCRHPRRSRRVADPAGRGPR